MCRVVCYLGPQLPLSAMLHRPDNALLTQAIDPKYLHMLNLAGFGMMCWNDSDDDPDEPLVYRSTQVPVYDANLASLSAKLRTTCTLAHIRGVVYRADAGHGAQNLHPFRYRGASLAMAHNGGLAEFSSMKVALAEHVRPEIRAQVGGTTDSEWVYALLLSQLQDPTASPDDDELFRALDRTLHIIRQVRRDAGIDQSSSLNLFISDGRRQLALRFTFDFGRYALDPSQVSEWNSRFASLWYTVGGRFEEVDGQWRMRGDGPPRAALLVSEPLTEDTTGWVEVPEYSAVLVNRGPDGLALRYEELDA